MKLFHSCGNVVSILAGKIAVGVMEVSINGAYVDIQQVALVQAKGKTTFHCSHCDEDVDFNDLFIQCARCGKPVSVLEVYHIIDEWSYMNLDCYERMLKELPPGMATSVRQNNPIRLKFR